MDAIDGIRKLGMNHPIGPLVLADLIGLDTVLNIMRVLHEGLDDEKYAPSPLLVSMVNEGKLGRNQNRFPQLLISHSIYIIVFPQ